MDVVTPEQKISSLADLLSILSKTDLARMLVRKSLPVSSELLKSLRYAFVESLHSEVEADRHFLCLVSCIDDASLINDAKDLILLLRCEFYATCLLNPANLVLLPVVVCEESATHGEQFIK